MKNIFLTFILLISSSFAYANGPIIYELNVTVYSGNDDGSRINTKKEIITEEFIPSLVQVPYGNNSYEIILFSRFLKDGLVLTEIIMKDPKPIESIGEVPSEWSKVISLINHRSQDLPKFYTVGDTESIFSFYDKNSILISLKLK
jgi:hypothetical protein